MDEILSNILHYNKLMTNTTELSLEELICRSIVSIADHVGLSTFEIEEIRRLIDEENVDLKPYMGRIFDTFN